MQKQKISLIAAIASGNRALGKDNQLIYKIKEDQEWFKNKTSGHTIIMGRRTYESIDHALPNRINIVVTRNPSFTAENITVVHSLEEALKLAVDEVFIIGGGQIYQEAIKIADRLYLTVVEGNPEADTFFPDYSQFTKVISEKSGKSEGYKYKFLVLEKS